MYKSFNEQFGFTHCGGVTPNEETVLDDVEGEEIEEDEIQNEVGYIVSVISALLTTLLSSEEIDFEEIIEEMYGDDDVAKEVVGSYFGHIGASQEFVSDLFDEDEDVREEALLSLVEKVEDELEPYDYNIEAYIYEEVLGYTMDSIDEDWAFYKDEGECNTNRKGQPFPNNASCMEGSSGGVSGYWLRPKDFHSDREHYHRFYHGGYRGQTAKLKDGRIKLINNKNRNAVGTHHMKHGNSKTAQAHNEAMYNAIKYHDERIAESKNHLRVERANKKRARTIKAKKLLAKQQAKQQAKEQAKEQAPKKTAPKKTATKKTAPKKTAPEKTATKKTATKNEKSTQQSLFSGLATGISNLFGGEK